MQRSVVSTLAFNRVQSVGVAKLQRAASAAKLGRKKNIIQINVFIFYFK